MAAMSGLLPFVINVVNTVFGVTVLAVPYCFHQCGLILGGLLLATSSYASKRSCSLLLKSAQISRKRDFESLGYLVGSAIAWFVIIGDVAPAVVSSLFGLENTWSLRLFLIVVIGIGAVLPLSLVKDIRSLASASNVAIGIYAVFVLQLFLTTLPKLLSGDWINGVNYWKPDGILQCLPIFGIAFLCQTVIFVLYEALPDPSVKQMEHVVNTAMDVVLLLSFIVGACGYVKYLDKVEGDLLNNYEHDFMSEFIRLGFCISTVLSFPLLVFPCRSSINSMISSVKIISVDTSPAGETYIPHDRFVIITCSLIVATMICGILFPNVEFVMALVGATMGALLTFVLPSYIFIKVTGGETSKTEAKVLLVLGLCLLCLSTFSVLSMSESHHEPVNIVPVQNVPDLPTTNGNNSQVQSRQVEKVSNSLRDSGEVANRSGVPKRKARIEKRNIDEKAEEMDLPPEAKATLVRESRREPVLPQENSRRRLQDQGKVLREDEKEVLKRQPGNEDLQRKPEGTNLGENIAPVEIPQQRLSAKATDSILNEAKKKTKSSVENTPGINKVRVRERRILDVKANLPAFSNNGVKSASDVAESKVSLADEHKLPKDIPVETEIRAENIKNDTLITNGA